MNSKKLVWGVGINDSPTPVQKHENGKMVWIDPYYHKWRKMLERGYSQKWKQLYPSYADVTVVEEWHRLSTFKRWIEEQQEPVTYHLDKDILFPGNTVYSPDTCLLVPQQVNALFLGVLKLESRGECPVGVYYDTTTKSHKKYRTCFSKFSRTQAGKRFCTPEEAHQNWIQLKKEYIKEIQEQQKNNKLINALQYWYDNLEELVK
jgi:hypothetical protein